MKKKVDLKKKGKVTVLSNVVLADVEEGDSGIDANSQGSCSSTDAKNAAAARVVAQSQTSTKKDKKKKGKDTVTVDVKTTSTTNVKLTTNSAATQTNAAKVNSSQPKSNKVSFELLIFNKFKFCFKRELYYFFVLGEEKSNQFNSK